MYPRKVRVSIQIDTRFIDRAHLSQSKCHASCDAGAEVRQTAACDELFACQGNHVKRIACGAVDRLLGVRRDKYSFVQDRIKKDPGRIDEVSYSPASSIRSASAYRSASLSLMDQAAVRILSPQTSTSSAVSIASCHGHDARWGKRICGDALVPLGRGARIAHRWHAGQLRCIQTAFFSYPMKSDSAIGFSASLLAVCTGN